MLTVLAHAPLLFMILVLFVGSLLGQPRIAGASLGPAAVLFVALGLTALGAANGVEYEVPEHLGHFGLMLFTFTIGVMSGPSFFASLPRGWPVMLTTTGCVVTAGLIAYGVGRTLDLPPAVIAGTAAGALTNTPALAAAGQAAGGAALPAVGYSISYLWGVVGMIIVTAWVLRHDSPSESDDDSPVEQKTIRVDKDMDMTVAQLVAQSHSCISVSRIQHDHQRVSVANDHDHIVRGDLISLVGPRNLVTSMTSELGHLSSHDIVGERTTVDYRRMTLSDKRHSGVTLRELALGTRFGAQVTRVRRADVDMVPGPEFVVQLGDRLRVVAPRDQMNAVRGFLGDSDRGFSDINASGLALGLGLGIALGMIPLPLPSGTFSLGSAAGALLVGLVFGRLRRVGPLQVSLSTNAANALSSLGMIIFLAFAGNKAGTLFAEAITSDMGWKIGLMGCIVTSAYGALLLGMRWLHRTPWRQLSGQIAGAQTQPAILAYANNRTNYDTHVSLGYVLVFPAAMVAKILVIQLLVVLG